MPPVIVSANQVVGEVQVAMANIPPPQQITVVRNPDGTYTVTVVF